MRTLRWWLFGDREGLERAKRADQHAAKQLKDAQDNGRAAVYLLKRNHLTERFLRELRKGDL